MIWRKVKRKGRKIIGIKIFWKRGIYINVTVLRGTMEDGEITIYVYGIGRLKDDQ